MHNRSSFAGGRLAFILVGIVGSAGCRNSPTDELPDLSHKTGDMAVTGSTDDMTVVGGNDMSKAYTSTTISALRQGMHSGAFSLDNVVLIGFAGSKNSSKLFVQDSAGGDFSALMAKCSFSSGSQPCPVFATAMEVHSVTLAGTYLRSKTTMIEDFYLDSFTDNGVGTPPAHTALTLADVERGAMKAANWFQRIDVTIAPADTLQVYDFAPPELKYSGAIDCTKQPAVFGFGMLPASTAGGAAGAACGVDGGVAAAEMTEVLVGTDFYRTFKASGDCACAKAFTGTKLCTLASTVVGAISGFLAFDAAVGATTGYQYFSPYSDATFPIGGCL